MSDHSLDWPRRVARALALLPPDTDDVQGAPAAVLIPLFVCDNTLHLWLLRRADHLRHHPGQIALPGGKPEPSDPDLLTTALREAHEEIGLLPAQVEVVGQLPPRLTSSRFRVTPFVGFVDPSFRPSVQATEVGRAFTAPLADFRGEGALRVPPTLPERGAVPSYLAAGEVVWGATAAMLGRLAGCVLPPVL